VTDRRRGVPVVLALIGLVAIGLAAWGALSWTLIPTDLDTTVVGTGWSEGGPPWKEAHTTDGALTVHTDLYERMGGAEGLPGQPLEKDPWARTVRVGGRDVALDVPWTSWKAVLLVAGLVVAAFVRLRRRLPAGGRGHRVRSSSR
jgi:hypothetical protein